MNSDEALKCLSIARRHLENKNYAGAKRFCEKSIALSSTSEAHSLLKVIDAEAGASSSPGGSSASASGAETHPSAAGTHRRTHNETQSSTPEKREHTPEQAAVVKRVRSCKVTEYYEILAVKQDCDESDVKKAYRKLALQLHPDKNGAPGADEAFKMVSKAFQVLSDANLRAAFDSAPGYDPASRSQSQAAATQQFRGGGGFQGEMTPEELFNMFFGGNGGFNGGGGFGGGFGGPVFTTSFGPGGFRTTRVRQPRAQNRGEDAPESTKLLQLLPILFLFAISFLGSLPSLTGLFSTPDPTYSFTPVRTYTSERVTTAYKVPYYVDKREFESHPIFASIPESSRHEAQAGQISPMLGKFENTVERVYISSLRQTCNREVEDKDQRIERHSGVFGFGADWETIKKIKAEPLPSCEKLRDMGVINY